MYTFEERLRVDSDTYTRPDVDPFTHERRFSQATTMPAVSTDT